MTAAPLHAIGRRLPASLALLAVIAFTACSGKSDGSSTKAAGAASGGSGADSLSAGPVVIAPPSGSYAAGAVSGAGSVTGTITVAGALSIAAPLPTGKDSSVCSTAIADSSAQQQGTGLGNAVVWLEGVRKGKAIPLEKRIELESDHCILTPRVQAAFVGGAVNVIAHDDFRQHLRFVAGGESKPRAAVLLGKDEQVIPSELPLKTPGLVIVRDIDHTWPRAFIAVFDHPYFAVTKPDGRYTIDQVPPGTYTLVVWHERAGRSEQKVTVTNGATATVDVKLDAK